MRRGAALILGFLLAAVGCSSNGNERTTAPAPRELTGIVWRDGGYEEVVRLDPARLRPQPGRRVPLGPQGGPWVLSPDRSLVAVGGPFKLRIVDLQRMRRLPDVPTGMEETVTLAWPVPDRLLLAGGTSEGREVEVIAVDLDRHRISSRRRIPGFVVDYAHGRRDLQLLVASTGRIGTCRLVVTDIEGRMRSARLARIPCGVRTSSTRSGLTVDHYRTPGLATGGGRSFVVSPDDLVAEVELDSFRTDYHELREKMSLLGRILGWLEPAAHAKGLSNGSLRSALWLGGDRLAVFGRNDHAFRGARGWSQRETPASLQLVDTESWTVRTIDSGADDALRADGLLLALGTSYSTADGYFTGDGLRTYTLSGDPVFHFFPGRPVWDVQVAGSRAYLSFEGAGENATVDLATGEVIARFEDDDPPSVLTGGRDRPRG